MTPAEVLALSDERDAQLAARLRAWHDGYRAAVTAAYEAGFLDGRAEVKSAQHAIARAVELTLTRWDGLRADYGKPRPGDFPGRDGDAP